MKKSFMNKKGMSVSIVLLVVFTMVIIGIIIGIFISNEKKLTYHYRVPSMIDELNYEVMQIDFYVNDIFHKAYLKGHDNVDEIIVNYKEILNDYQSGFLLKYKDEIIKQLNSDNILIKDDRVFYHIRLVVYKMQEDNAISVRYDFDKWFQYIEYEAEDEL
ncbi:hypothetical protein GOV12_04295 [Candidatus Pacearchaeota archaeon]|nr:hypothetical protein [Candidatus Pacearchaeota archaeon]